MNPLSMRIQVVDDDLAVRFLMQATLEKAGFAVTLAESGEEALRQFHEAPCDLVMLDVDMPGLDGYQVCTRLRSEVGVELPIVMVTGMDDIDSIERAFAAGATDYITKPINWALIGHRARYLLRSYLVLQELRLAHARVAALLDAIPGALLRLDADGQVLDVYSGRSWRQGNLPWPYQPLAASFPAPACAAIQAGAARVRATGMAETLACQLAAADGLPRCYEARLVPIDARETLCMLSEYSETTQAEA